MTRHKKLSSLSIAAAAILAAAIPCVAQIQSDELRAETGGRAAITVAEPTVAMNRERLAPKTTTVVTPSAQPLSLSPAMFAQAADQFSAGATQRFLTSQANIFTPREDVSRKQFKADDDYGPSQRPQFTFVPSRGQKLPN